MVCTAARGGGGGRLSQKIFYLIPRVQYLNCYSSLLPFWQRLSKQLCAVRFFPSLKTENFKETVEKLLKMCSTYSSDPRFSGLALQGDASTFPDFGRNQLSWVQLQLVRYAAIRKFAKLGFDFCSGPLYYSETVTEGQFGKVLTYAWLTLHKGQVGNEKKSLSHFLQ